MSKQSLFIKEVEKLFYKSKISLMSKIFGANLKKIRKNFNLTQEAFGEMLNVSFQAISKWELGYCEPDLDTLILICKKFNISSDNLLGLDAEE